MKLTRRQKITIVALVFYWIVLAIVAHIPIPQLVYRAQVSDKWLHFLAYLNLAFLLWFSVRPDSKISWRNRLVWLIFLAAAAYGGIDELIQPYFGRTKDLWDFLANVAGASAGLIMFTVLTFWQALPAVLAVTIFGLTNLAKADLSKLAPITNAVFHILAYGGFTLVWIQFINLYFLLRTTIARLAAAIVVPVVFLLVVKTGAILLGRHFALTDLLFSALTIIAVAAITAIPRHRRFGAS
ncbi:MAG: VanZ family protein [Planctomycetota bacterium]